MDNEKIFQSLLGNNEPVKKKETEKFDFMAAVKNTITDVPYNTSVTENGAVGYETTGHPLLDINFAITSLRNESSEEIIDMFEKAYYDTPREAIMWMFYLRDIRGGAGERRSFRILLKHMCNTHPSHMASLIPLVAEYGRYDDLWVLLETKFKKPILELVKNQIISDLQNAKENKPITLLGKWLPSRNATSKESRKKAKVIYEGLEIAPATYQKICSTLRKYLKVVEVDMSEGRWSVIDYNKVPSRANLRYKNAFLRHDEERRRAYLAALERHEEGVKINAGTLFPHDILGQYVSGGRWGLGKVKSKDPTLEALWEALPSNDTDLTDVMIVADGSWSMWTGISGGSNICAEHVCWALALYFAERAKGAYANKFITFSSRPKYVDIGNCDSLSEKILCISKYTECSNTNVEKVFDLILDTAKRNNLTQDQLPKTILILSDMEFDIGCHPRLDKTLFGHIGQKFKGAGYKMPKLAFWNLCSRTKTIPVIQNDFGLVLLSGFSPAIVKMVMTGSLDPFEALLDVLYDDRYKPVYDLVKDIKGEREMEETEK